jgi:hypothetical protein
MIGYLEYLKVVLIRNRYLIGSLAIDSMQNCKQNIKDFKLKL